MSSAYTFLQNVFFKKLIVLIYILPILCWLPALTGLYVQDPSVFVGSVGIVSKLRFGLPWIDPNVGFQAQALGKLSADLWLKGVIPWWNPYNGVGLPLAAEAQPGALFLPFILFYHFRSGGMWVELLLQIIAGQFTYLLLRKLNIANHVAVVCAILYELNGTYAWHGAPIIAPVAFLPMILFGVERLREKVVHGGSGGWFFIPLALAWSLYAGFPETAYINGLFVAIWCLSRLSGLDSKKRFLFIKYLSLSVIVGVLLSAPLLFPFFEYLNQSVIGGHKDLFAHAGLPKSAFLQFFAPYLYGPIWAFGSKNIDVSAIWGNVGGYFTGIEFFIALSACFLSPSRLTLALLIWILMCIGKIYNFPLATDLFNLVPFIKSAAFFRYANPCISMAGVILISFALDGLVRGVRLHGYRLVFLVLLLSFFLIIGVMGSKAVISSLLSLQNYKWYLFSSIIWLIASILLASFIFQFGVVNQKKSIFLLSFLLCADALFGFVLPIFSGAARLSDDGDGLKFLRSNIGLSRSYSIGPLSPNYGAFFGLAQINHNYLPINKTWVDYIHSHLDSSADDVTFIGSDAGRKGARDSAIEEVLDRKQWYSSIGVRYIIVPHDSKPFSISSSAGGQGNVPVVLNNNDEVSFKIRIAKSEIKKEIDSIDILIGNYGRTSDGKLGIELCGTVNVCSSGYLSLSSSMDNVLNHIELDRPIDVPSNTDAVFNLTISHRDAGIPVVIWMWPNSGENANMKGLGAAANLFPKLDLNLTESNHLPIGKVYSGADMDIYELPNAAPYFEAKDSSCTVSERSRTVALVDCAKSGVLIRREMYYPGWRAYINGVLTQVSPGAEIFQKVLLPKGKYVVSFDYMPTNFWQFMLLFLIGVVFLLYAAYCDFEGKRVVLFLSRKR